MIEQLNTSVKFIGFFLASGLGATGLTVTVDVYNPAGTKIVTDGSATGIGGGLYSYTLASGSVTTEGEYLAVFKTAGTADQKHVAALWVVGRAGVENLDATISSRNATTPPTASAVASQVRTELTTELGRIDASVSTRSSHSAADVWSVATRTLTSGAGSGAYAITVTVTDGTDPLQGAIVRVSEGVTALTATTDAAGQAVFALDAATYAVAVTKAGYQFTPTTRTVTGEEAGTLTDDLEMTAVTVPSAPEDAALCRVYGYLETVDNLPAAGVVVTFELLATDLAKSERLISDRKQTATSDANGFIQIDLQRNDLLTPAGTQYRATCRKLKLDETISLAAATFDLGSLVS